MINEQRYLDSYNIEAYNLRHMAVILVLSRLGQEDCYEFVLVNLNCQIDKT